MADEKGKWSLLTVKPTQMFVKLREIREIFFSFPVSKLIGKVQIKKATGSR